MLLLAPQDPQYLQLHAEHHKHKDGASQKVECGTTFQPAGVGDTVSTDGRTSVTALTLMLFSVHIKLQKRSPMRDGDSADLMLVAAFPTLQQPRGTQAAVTNWVFVGFSDVAVRVIL